MSNEDMQAMASLFRKKGQVIKILSGGLDKGGKNDFHKYKYVTASDVKHAVGDAMIEVGLSLQMGMVESRHINVPAKNGDALILQVQFQITLCDIDTGATESSLWLGEAGLSGQDDKAANKAATAALKYYFLCNFLIGDKEEDDHDADQDGHLQPKPTSQTAPRSTKKEAPPATPHWSQQEGMMEKMYVWAWDTHKVKRDEVDLAIVGTQKTLISMSRDDVKGLIANIAAMKKGIPS